MIATSPKTSFIKEVLLALLILGNCFIPSLHLLASDELTTITLFNYEYNHGYVTNQTFIWSVLCQLQVLVYTVLFFLLSRRRFRWALLFLIYWIIYEFLWETLYPWTTKEHIAIVQYISILLTAIFAVLATYFNFRTMGNPDSQPKEQICSSDLVVTILLIALPILGKLADEISYDLQELQVFGLTISNHGFPYVAAFIWYILKKTYLLLPLLLFFLTTKKWWAYALLVPILLAVFQIKAAFNSNSEHIDTYEIFEAAPLLLLVLALLLFLSNTAYYQSKMKELYMKTYDHIEEAIQRKFKGREYFLSQTKAKWQKMKKSDEINENELHQLKKHLEQELRKSNY